MLPQLLLFALCANAPLPSLQAPRPLGQSKLLKHRSAGVQTSRGDAGPMYKKVAASTVLVRLEDSYGSGVVISKDGLILTNHHVVADGAIDDLAVAVTITRGRMDAGGLMQRVEESLSAHVLAWNAETDVALLKLDAPPADLAFAPLATQPVTPGAQVYALGHGGIGLLWSMRVCNVSAVGGDNETAVSLVVLLGSREARPLPPAKRTVVQTNCPITPGDSGGPLFNEAGEVVALNDYFRQEKRDGAAFGTPTYFHVELRHLKELADAPPAAPMRRVPDPWAGVDSVVLSDLDGDGSPETLGLWKGRQLAAVLFDGLQRTASAGVDAARRNKAYPAHVTVHANAGDLMMEVGNTLLVLDGATVKAAYAVKQGNASPLAKEAWPATWTSALPASTPDAAARLERLVKWTLPALGSGGDAVIPSLKPDGKSTSVGDDDALTTLGFRTAAGVAIVMDAESQRPGDAPLSRELLAGFSPRLGLLVNQLGKTTHFLFDSDGDGQWDRSVLMGPRGGQPLTTLRADLKGSSGWAAGPSVSQLDPRWASVTPQGAARVTKLLSKLLAREVIAGLSPWPALNELEGELEIGTRNKGKGKEAVLMLSGGDVEGVLIAGPVVGDAAVVQQKLSKGTLKPAFAFLTSVKGQWALYDWNVDGKIDLALLSDGEAGVAEAYVLQKDGSHQLDKEAAEGALLRWKGFKSPDVRKFVQAALDETFEAGAIER